jgi:iron complex transport system permease protein
MPAKNKLNLYKFIIFLILALTFIITPFIGTVPIDSSVFSSGSLAQQIIFEIRLPRIVFAFLVGLSLALVGTIFQALLRNELATPYTLGISSGGALGAVIAIKTGIDISIWMLPSTVIFSICGSILTIFLIFTLARSKFSLSPVSLILTGVTIGLVFSSLILFIHYLADFTETYRMIRWLMGGLQVSGWEYVLFTIPMVILALFYFYRQSSAINIISAGRELALSKGVDVYRLQKSSFFLGSVLVGVVVAFAGPIGFVGLIIPHLMRILIGPDHKNLIFAAALFGGSFLVWCDTVARTIIEPAELPVGVITALIGGPFFVWLLYRSKKGI